MANCNRESKVKSGVISERLALRVNEFCERAGISPSTFWKYVQLGKIRVIRIGGRTLVPFSEVERILVDGVRR
jgi:excisionase family DNA binding protein